MAQIIQQGSTPTHRFSTPYEKASVDSAIITYWQNGRIVLEKHTEDINIQDHTMTTELSQEDTLLFDERGDVKMQIKVKLTNGKVIPSNDMYASVKDVLNKEVM
ncbi:MAG: hypothetical protein U0M06_02335 [Clostridia bacterium]|nr:hypothetical protein [Clostridia bacterium]